MPSQLEQLLPPTPEELHRVEQSIRRYDPAERGPDEPIELDPNRIIGEYLTKTIETLRDAQRRRESDQSRSVGKMRMMNFNVSGAQDHKDQEMSLWKQQIDAAELRAEEIISGRYLVRMGRPVTPEFAKIITDIEADLARELEQAWGVAQQNAAPEAQTAWQQAKDRLKALKEYRASMRVEGSGAESPT